MKNILFYLASTITLVFWPISLIISNQSSWSTYTFPALVLLVDYTLYKKNFSRHHLVLLLIPLVIFISSPKAFYGYSIFTPDPLRFDTLIKKINLIPNRNLARVFENKTTVPTEKFVSNVFLELDLNNYFFSLHPREIIGENQSLQKYPLFALFAFLYGLYLIPKNKDKKWIIFISVLSIIGVSLVNNPDKFDFLMYVPVSLIIVSGLKYFSENFTKLSYFAFPIYIIFSIFEFARVIILK
jgi:hypothetical protein